MIIQNQCRVCGLLMDVGKLCKRHRKRYRYNKKYDFVCLKPRKKISKPQTALFRNVREIWHKPTYQEAIFDWCAYHRFDIAIPDLFLIVEYDGKQHFEFTKLFHKTKENFEKYKGTEKLKSDLAKANGWQVIRFSYIEHVEDIEYVRKVVRLKCQKQQN